MFSDTSVPGEELLAGDVLVDAISHFLHEYETARRTPNTLTLMYARATATVNVDTDVPQDDVQLRIKLPLGAVWSDEPPWLPQEGIYSFPSGNFRPLRDLGWPLAMTGSRKNRRIHNSRLTSLLCIKCRLSMSALIGPFVTTLIVHKPESTARHTCEPLKSHR
jgi:hypothetical protein